MRGNGPAWLGAFGLLLSLLAPGAQAAPRMPWPRRPGVILFRERAGADATARQALQRLLQRMSADTRLRAMSVRSHSALRTADAATSEEDMAERMRNTGAVDFAEPDYAMRAAAVPNDADYPTQWYHPVIQSPSAWDITQGDSNVVAAVCDTGIDSAHPDLSANMSLPGINIVDGTSNTQPVADHGTEVAGVLGAIGNDGIGGAGIAWRLKILPVRITNNSDTTAWCSDMASGIEWSADHGAGVINLSYDISGCPSTIDAAAGYARTRGALVFVAAGNSAVDLTGLYPATHNFILVGASDESDQLASFSNYGAPVDMIAPGSSIWTTSPGGRYAFMNGTSFAAPMAAGAAALILALSSQWTPDQVQNFLYGSAVGPGLAAKDPKLGHGRLNVGLAVQQSKSVLSGLTPPVVTASAGGTFSWPGPVSLQATATENGQALTTAGAATDWSMVSGPGQVTFVNSASLDTTATFSYAGTYRLRLTAVVGGLLGTGDIVVNVGPDANGLGGLPAPILQLPSVVTVRSRISAQFPPGYSVARYQWSIAPAEPGAESSTPSSAILDGAPSGSWSTADDSADLSARELAPGYYKIVVCAYDANGIVSPSAQAFVDLVPADLAAVRVHPNPWRADRHTGAPITFDQLASNSTVTIFTVSGRRVRMLSANPTSAGWDLTNDAGDRVASGVYLYLVRDDQGQKAMGKLAVIR